MSKALNLLNFLRIKTRTSNRVVDVLQDNNDSENINYNKKFNVVGISNNLINLFGNDSDLIEAITMAIECIKLYEVIEINGEKFTDCSEESQIVHLQKDILNFYMSEDINPYVPLAAKGPWIITTFGSVIYDTGSYGMLGFGHNPNKFKFGHHDCILGIPQVMANVMTAQLPQLLITEALNKEIKYGYKKYMFLNSGSEAMALALRLSDANVKNLEPNGFNVPVKILSLSRSFHGRLDRSAQASDSTMNNYKKYLGSYSGVEHIVIEPNDIEALIKVFSRKDIFIEAMVMEPVMGEGNPGLSISKEFYQVARILTKNNNALLIVDSVQAGIRATGHLSCCDYLVSDFKESPDIEVFSKAINAGQFPLSIIGTNRPELYKHYIYGNTMTANPRALVIATEILSVLPSIRTNIQESGKLFLTELKKLKNLFPEIIESAQGTGLLLSLKINNKYKVIGEESIEYQLRKIGLGSIHGSNNTIRFTPYFFITIDEIHLIIMVLKTVFSKFTKN